MRPPFLGVCLGLDLELIGHPFAFQLPVIFVDCRVDDLLLFVDRSHSNVLLIVEIVLVGHLCLIDHLLVILWLVLLLIGFRLVPWISSSLLRRWVLVPRLLECEVLPLQALRCKLRQNKQHLLATSSLQLQRRELAVDLQLLTLVDDIGRNGHRVIVFAEIRRGDVIEPEEILHQTRLNHMGTS